MFYAALKRRSSTVAQAGCIGAVVTNDGKRKGKSKGKTKGETKGKSKNKSNVKIKSNGQECPFHTVAK